MKNENINDKRAGFLDMQEHPENYTDEQIEALLGDEDIKEFAHYMAMTKRAIIGKELVEPDVEAAWQSFSKAHPSRRSAWRKAAAAVVGGVFLSGIALAAAFRLGFLHPATTPPTSPSTPIHTPATGTDTLRRDTPATPKDSLDLTPVTFDNAQLDTILTQMGRHYHVKVVFNDARSRHLRLYFRWDKRLNLQQQVDLLNAFDHLHLTFSDNILTVE